ncbi:MAG: 3-dehydroquinate synthase [Actinobacteria bacterium]|nr:3-dehydroquinate synthase [Actinomycetota bacterium]
MIRIPVALGPRGYDVVVGRGILAGEAVAGAPFLPPHRPVERAFVVSDPRVARAWLGPAEAGLLAAGVGGVVHLPIPEGEQAKSLQVVEALCRQLAVQEAHRDDLVVALGGGVAGDVAGFAAATYMRGVPFLQVPTTLTAQVDAAIGGKTGVNLPEGKNLVGAFHQPVGVVADVLTLVTLPEREFRSGLAEVAKVALVFGGDLLEALERDPGPLLAREPGALEEAVARCVRAKAEVVAADERDEGRRLVLNYGHTLGHALERLDAFAGRTHGEGVAVGMAFAARLAEATGVAGPGLVSRHARLLASLGLPGGGPLPAADDVLRAFRMDKKYRGGARFVLLAEAGSAVVVPEVPEGVLRSVREERGAGRAGPVDTGGGDPAGEGSER